MAARRPVSAHRVRLAPLLSAWLPVPCLFCGACGAHQGICAGCLADLPGRSAARCPVCAIATPQGELCGACLRTPPAFTRTLAAADYAWPLDAAIGRFKYGPNLALVAGLAALLRATVQHEPRPDLLLAMPLSPARVRERGFNQAVEIAKVLAAELRLPLEAAAVQRTREAPPQASLPLDQRARNVRGAFEARAAAVAGRHVAIVDDVMTTGASLDELARGLRAAGARDVACWVLARTPPPR
jgi:ComF family protein